MTCPSGGYPTARHNEVRDLIASTMEGVFHNVEIEPLLLSYQNEELPGPTVNCTQVALVDIKARGFWTCQQNAIFDIRITHPKADLQCAKEVEMQLLANEREKKRKYAERISSVDRGVFTPLVYATNGMVGRECDLFLKFLAGKIVQKYIHLTYSAVINRLHCKLAPFASSDGV